MDSSEYFKNTPLHVAASKAKLKDVRYLLNERKVSPFVRNSFWKTPVQLVEEKMLYWQKRGMMDPENNVNLSKKASENVLKDIITLRKQDFKEVKNVLESAVKDAKEGDVGTDEDLLRSSNYDKRTALHLAVAEGHYDLVEFIIGKIDIHQINEPDRWGSTPPHEALKNGDDDIIKLFKMNMTESEFMTSFNMQSPS
ncbi:glutaminase, partial [Mytilus galloprovincialis]